MDKNKRILLVLLIASLSILSLFVISQTVEIKATYSRPAPPEGYGDINGDGYVSYAYDNVHKHDFWLLYAFYDEYGPWDINEDGIVNTSDVDEITKAWTGSVTSSIYTHLRSDITWDDRVNVNDIYYVLQFWNETKTEPLTLERMNQVENNLNVNYAFSIQDTITRGDVDGDGVLTDYDVYLIIQYAKGAISEFPIETEQTNMPPVASLDKEIYETTAYKEITFDASASYDPDGTIVGYRFVISKSSEVIVDSGFIQSPTFSYSDFPYPSDLSDSYSITLTVKDDDGETAQDTASIRVYRGLNQPPVAILSQHEYNIKWGDTVTFDASQSYDPEGLPIKFNWYINNIYPIYDNFGDYPTLTYTFNEKDKYFDKAYIFVKVKDMAGETAFDVAVVNISRTISLNLTWTPERPLIGTEVYFDASGSYAEGATITSYSFLIDDKYSSGWNKDPYYRYTFYSPGEHKVTLSVKLDDSIIKSKTWTINVVSEYTEPTIIVEGELKEGNELRITVFYPFKVDWINIDYGDGTKEGSPLINANQYTFTHTYEHGGIYTINATALKGFGSYAYAETTIEIKETTPPPPDFWLYVIIGIVGVVIIAISYMWKKKGGKTWRR